MEKLISNVPKTSSKTNTLNWLSTSNVQFGRRKTRLLVCNFKKRLTLIPRSYFWTNAPSFVTYRMSEISQSRYLSRMKTEIHVKMPSIFKTVISTCGRLLLCSSSKKRLFTLTTISLFVHLSWLTQLDLTWQKLKLERFGLPLLILTRWNVSTIPRSCSNSLLQKPPGWLPPNKSKWLQVLH